MADSLDSLKTALADRYAIDIEIGSGGMATVYLAEDLKHHRKVAVKVLRPELATALGPERFLLEIEIAAKLNHAHIMPLYDSGGADGWLYYVMPLAEGETLRERLDRERQLPLDDALRIAGEVAEALTYAHDRGVIHRDVKPENIMLQAGHAVITDFGIARAVSEAGGDRLTETGIALGTPTYMSPEQAGGGGDVDQRSDIYSLACLLYEMLAGEPPFSGPSAQAIMARHVMDTPHSLRAVRNTVPQAVENAIARALNKVPADRYSTAGEFAKALRKQGVDSATGAARAKSRSVIAAAVAVAVVVGIVAIGVAVRSGGPAATGPPALAVLPFENLGAADDEFFADGITEEITSRLAAIGGLLVMSRTSAKRFKGTDQALPDIGRALRVEYILEGSVRIDRGPTGVAQVRVTPQLRRASDETNMWGQSYDASLVPGEILGVQAEIAEQVAAALNVTLLETEQSAVRAVTTEDSVAHRLYLLGRFQLAKRSAEGLMQAQQLFREAIARDQDYAAAYAGLADAISLHNFFSAAAQGPAAWAPAEQAATRAVALDSLLPQAHASLGLTRMYGEWDWDGARQSYGRALELDPDNAEILYWFAEVDWVQGQLDSALAKTKRAVDIDPLSAVANSSYGMSLWHTGQHREGASWQARAISLQPSLEPVIWLATWMHSQTGQTEEAQLYARQFFETSDPGQQVPQSLIEATVAVTGGRADLSTTVRVVQAWESHGLDDMAAIFGFGSAGFLDSAFARLNTAIDRRNEFFLVMLNVYYEFLGDDPRWEDALDRMGLDWR